MFRAEPMQGLCVSLGEWESDDQVLYGQRESAFLVSQNTQGGRRNKQVRILKEGIGQQAESEAPECLGMHWELSISDLEYEIVLYVYAILHEYV